MFPVKPHPPRIADRIALGLFVLIGTFFLAIPLLECQESDPKKTDEYTVKVPVDLVLVPVTVEDGGGMPIPGLQKENFKLSEQGVPQQVSFFSVDPFPMSVAILIDRTGDAKTFAALKETLVPLTEAFSAFDEMAVYQFENTLDKVQDFTADKDEVLKAFKRISLVGAAPALSSEPFSNGTTINGISMETATGKVPPPKTINIHIDDAIFNASIDLRQRSKNRRRVILVISNGQNAPGNRHSFEDTVEALTRNEVVVYGIGQGTAFLMRKNILTRYANSTGGSVCYPVGVNGFSETYQKIAQLARNQYILGYIPDAKVVALSYRRIEVTVESKEIKVSKVRHRKGYYAVPHL